MSELEEKLSALMSNPQLMQQITAMAQSMGKSPQQPEPAEQPVSGPSLPDSRLLHLLSQTTGHAAADGNQQALLQALSPYLSTNRMQKLERAMRAARLAGTASAFLNSGGLQLLSGR